MYALFVLLLALGTFWFFPGLARALVAFGLIGVVALAGWVVYDLSVRQPAKDAARAPVEAQEQAADARCVAWIADTDVCLRTAGERRLGLWRPMRPQLEAFREAHPDWEAFTARECAAAPTTTACARRAALAKQRAANPAPEWCVIWRSDTSECVMTASEAAADDAHHARQAIEGFKAQTAESAKFEAEQPTKSTD